MSDYLTTLAARVLRPPEPIRPRVPLPFEPIQPIEARADSFAVVERTDPTGAQEFEGPLAMPPRREVPPSRVFLPEAPVIEQTTIKHTTPRRADPGTPPIKSTILPLPPEPVRAAQLPPRLAPEQVPTPAPRVENDPSPAPSERQSAPLPPVEPRPKPPTATRTLSRDTDIPKAEPALVRPVLPAAPARVSPSDREEEPQVRPVKETERPIASRPEESLLRRLLAQLDSRSTAPVSTRVVRAEPAMVAPLPPEPAETFAPVSAVLAERQTLIADPHEQALPRAPISSITPAVVQMPRLTASTRHAPPVAEPTIPPAPVIEVSIGRIEIRAERPATGRRTARTDPVVMSLDEYLSRRRGGGA